MTWERRALFFALLACVCLVASWLVGAIHRARLPADDCICPAPK